MLTRPKGPLPLELVQRVLHETIMDGFSFPLDDGSF